MRFSIGSLLACFLLLNCAGVKAQSKPSEISGIVYLPNNVFAAMATVALLKQVDSSLVATTVTGKSGAFSFGGLYKGVYILLVKKQGFLKYTTAIPFTGQSVQLPSIVLQASNTILNEVTIIDRKRFIDVRSDKTVLNVEKGVLASGSSVFDVLISAPGIRVLNNDEILYKGGQKALVTINGKITNLSAQDLAAQLRNMQSGDIESIELIANPSSRYDAVGPGGVVNIILKKGKNAGLNGSLAAGVGYGNFYKDNASTSLNYRTAKANIFGTVNFIDGKTDHTINIDRNVGSSAFIYRYYNTQTTTTPSIRLGTDYFIDSLHTLGFLVSAYHTSIGLDKSAGTDILTKSTSDSSLYTSGHLGRSITSASYNLNYSGNIGHTRQVLSADADYTTFRRDTHEDLLSDFFSANNKTTVRQIFRSTVPTRISIASFRVDYVNTLSAKAKIEAGFKSSFVKSDNDQQFGTMAGNAFTADPFFSSYFMLKDVITAGYVNYSKKGKKLDYNIGLRVEKTHSDATSNTAESNKVLRDYTDFLPQAQITYKYGNGNRLALIYNRRLDRPTYEDLNPIVAYQDKYNYRQGNAFLQPSYQDYIQLSHTLQGKYVTSLYFLHVADFYNFNYFSQNDITKVYTTTKINLRGMYTYGFIFNAPASFTSWWNANLDIDASYQRFNDYAGFLNQGTTDVIIKFNQDFDFGKGLTAGLRTNYETPTFYGINRFKAAYYAGAGISKKILKQAGTISLSMEDIFNTRRDRYSSNFINLNVSGFDKKETQVTRISFAYRFGKKTVKAARTHDAGNTAEKSRIVTNN